MLTLGLLNLILLVLSIFIFFPKDFFKQKNLNLIKIFKKNQFFLFIIFAVVIFHLIEVNLIDPIITEQINHDYANQIQSIEGDIVHSFSKIWNDYIVLFLVFIYIGVYPFTLWFTTGYFLLTDKKKSLKHLSFGLLFIYIFALPFYLFLPITNVYTYYNASSALETVIPTVENFFYTTTTCNNCLPSLHTAMTILIAYTVSLTDNKKYFYFTTACAILVIFSVIYLMIHWILDILAGFILAIGVILILRHYFDDTRK
jgi:membrane-associated phospholipid phosphatase